MDGTHASGAARSSKLRRPQTRFMQVAGPRAMPGVGVGTQIQQRQGRGRTTSQDYEACEGSEPAETARSSAWGGPNASLTQRTECHTVLP